MRGVEVRLYRQRVLWGPFQNVTPADMEVVERAIGRLLPADYREFISLASGATLPYAVRLPPGEADGELLEFSSLTQVHGARSPAPVRNGFKETVMAAHLPSTLLEVACDGGGSTLYLDLGAESDYLDMLVVDEDDAREVWEESLASAG